MTEAEQISALEARVSKLESAPPATSSASWNSFVAAIAPYIPGWPHAVTAIISALAAAGTTYTATRPAATPAPVVRPMPAIVEEKKAVE